MGNRIDIQIQTVSKVEILLEGGKVRLVALNDFLGVFGIVV